ncbi:hypothetical protein K7G95_01255 (plasmid) [Escherichia coli]|nr:hypothetical protein K7G95_01255 [Escherichia coli]
MITDALSWAMTHFDELGYNCKTGKQKLQIMPNMVGFQFVLRGICSRLGAPNRKADIVVDQQSQFNTTQRELRSSITRYVRCRGYTVPVYRSWM